MEKKLVTVRSRGTSYKPWGFVDSPRNNCVDGSFDHERLACEKGPPISVKTFEPYRQLFRTLDGLDEIIAGIDEVLDEK